MKFDFTTTHEFEPSLHLVFYGKPVPQPRARATTNTKSKYTKIRMVDPAAQKKIWVRSDMTRQMAEQSFAYRMKDAVGVSFRFSMGNSPCAKTHGSGKPIRPDIDNLIKFYLDCMNELVYEDDRQVTSLRATKCHSKLPSTEIHIWPDSMTKVRIRLVTIFQKQEYNDFRYVNKTLNYWGLQGYELVELEWMPEKFGQSLYASLRKVRLPDDVGKI